MSFVRIRRYAGTLAPDAHKLACSRSTQPEQGPVKAATNTPSAKPKNCHWRGRNRKRRDEQDVEGVQEIVEIYQSQPSVHLYRKGAEGEWVFEAVDEMEGVLTLRSIGIDLPLAEIYEGVDFTESE